MHRTSMGNDADPLNLWVATLRMGLVDNFAGLMLATDLSDSLRDPDSQGRLGE